MKVKFILFLILIAMISKIGSTQTIDTDFRKKAADYYANSEWDKAIEMYSKIVSAEDKNLNAWSRLTSSYIQKKDDDKAFSLLKTAVTKGDNLYIWYNLSCQYAKRNMKEKAIESLKKAIIAGYLSSAATLIDQDFSTLKNDKDFLAVVEEMKKQEFPCMYNEKLNEFAFWIGEWNVYNIYGNKVGDSKIEKILNECIMLENWTSANGRSGKSFNTINSNTGNWEQTWVDDFGTVTEYKKGVYSNGALSFLAEGKDAANKTQYQKLTFFKNDDGTVRQLGESSTDENTWTITYDLLYKKKN